MAPIEAIRVKSNNIVKSIAKETVKIKAGFLKLTKLFKLGTCFIPLNIPNIREAEYTLAITPETVAIIARKIVNTEPHSPNIGLAAAAKA